MGERRQTYRVSRLEALKARVDARAECAGQEKDHALKELVILLSDIDPIPRKRYWPAWAIRELARSQRGICAKCGDALPALHEGAVHVHHVIPWALGGGNEHQNVKLLHDRCNLELGRRCDDDDLIDYLRGRVANL